MSAHDAPRATPISREDAEDGARRYRSELAPIIRAVLAAIEGADASDATLAPEALDRILRRHPREGTGFFSKSELIAGYRALAASEGFPVDAARFERAIRRKRVRTQSGVAPVTVFTSPFPCPGRCVFCPNDVRMPKSYLAAEPGAQRAADNQFDPYLQTWNRLAAFCALGHVTDKVELIVLGGTWSSHPEAYQRWFVARCFDAISDFGDGIDGRALAKDAIAALPRAARAVVGDASADERSYNRAVRVWLRRHSLDVPTPLAAAASWDDVEASQRRNESARARCVGLSFETRPDCVTAEEVLRLRRLGATKVQLGVQSLDDAVLTASARGHDVATTRRAFAWLRSAGFKIQAHWMPNLPGATPESDVRDFERLVADHAFGPDEIKVYPCSLVASAELAEVHVRGEWRPYSHDELLEVLVAVLERAPRWSRLTRVIRDISSDDIVVGNKLTNFREIASRELSRRGGRAVEIRAREVGAGGVASRDLRLRETRRATSIGTELFLEVVDSRDRIAGFLRLSLPDARAREFSPSELLGSALVRELHVYGEAQPIGVRSGVAPQHRGLGGALLERAAELAHACGFERLSVISAIGTRAYYRDRGFENGALYQQRALA